MCPRGHPDRSAAEPDLLIALGPAAMAEPSLTPPQAAATMEPMTGASTTVLLLT